MLKGVPKSGEVRSTKVKLAPKWGQGQEKAFHALKSAMLTTVPLTLLDTTRICYISPDASDFAIGAALQQKVCKCPESWDINQGCTCPMRPMAFLSRKLASNQAQWSVREKECYAIVASLHKWAHYIGTNIVRVQSDHESLQSWHKDKVTAVDGPTGRHASWRELFS